jgi:GT2 family glycosyltransferase/glycosyltransferase involved in cell wall biosynthesis
VTVFPLEPDPVVSIVIVAWRDAPLLLTCLESVRENVTGVPYEVILVLNEPSSDLVTQVERNVRGATVLRFRSNLGFGGGVNVAAARARGPYLMLLNDDAVVERGWLEALVETIRRRIRCGMAGSTYLHPDGSLQEAGSVLWSDGNTSAVGDEIPTGDWRFERRVDYCSGGSLLIRKEAWDQLGGFDDRYYPAYFEDLDLALRAGDEGWEVWYQPLSVLRHVRSASAGRLKTFLYERSRSQFLDRWGPRLHDYQDRGQYEAAIWRAMGHPLRILVIDDFLPDESIGAGYGRTLEMVLQFAATPGFHVAIYPAVGRASARPDLVEAGVRVVSQLRGHLDTGAGYDVVIFSRPNNFWNFHDLVKARLPDAKLIYDAEALFFRRLEAKVEFDAPEERRAAAKEAAEIRRLEEWILATADAVVCISDDEAQTVGQMTDAPVHVIDSWLATKQLTTAPFEQRMHIGLVAGWLAGPGSPNCHGLLWFAREVLPRIRAELPGCRLLVTGADPPPDVSWLAGRSVEFVGHVPKLRDFYSQIRVAISPTLYGAGVKMKTVEAIQSGVPVVATTEAVGGLSPTEREAVWTADDPGAFAEAVVALHRDVDAWNATRSIQAELVARPQGSSSTPRWLDVIEETVRMSDHAEVTE